MLWELHAQCYAIEATLLCPAGPGKEKAVGFSSSETPSWHREQQTSSVLPDWNRVQTP